MQSITRIIALATTGLLLSACASTGAPPAGQTVSLVNSLSWVNPIDGKRDGSRTSWPLKEGRLADEYFPLAQLKQCDAQKQCAFGVMRAKRSVAKIDYAEGGINVTFELDVDVARRQAARQGEVQTAMAIPKDVSALAGRQQIKRTFGLKYGKVEQVELDYGVRYQLCAQRHDASGKAIDVCEIPFI